MALENLLSKMGMGTKQLADRYSEYGAPMPDQHVYYAYEPSPPPTQTAASKHHHSSGGGLKSNASMSALTLLAFLFFLHILQQCIKEHMAEMSSTPIMVMTAGREGEVELKTSKIDKTGTTDIDGENGYKYIDKTEIKVNPYLKDTDDKMMKINPAEHKPTNERNEYIYKNSAEHTYFPGFVSAMDDE